MGRKRLLDEVDKWKELSQVLSTSKKVKSYDTDKDSEAWVLSHNFSDLEGSFIAFLDELLPKLVNDNLTEDEVEEVLFDIGEEFRHIIYHINDNQFFKYVSSVPIELDTAE